MDLNDSEALREKLPCDGTVRVSKSSAATADSKLTGFTDWLTLLQDSSGGLHSHMYLLMVFYGVGW